MRKRVKSYGPDLMESVIDCTPLLCLFITKRSMKNSFSLHFSHFITNSNETRRHETQKEKEKNELIEFIKLVFIVCLQYPASVEFYILFQAIQLTQTFIKELKNVLF